jgi:adenylate kinase
MQEKINLVAVVGMEGSGKSTVADSVVKTLGYQYVSTGGMLRDAEKNDNGPLGEACRKMFKEHVYLSPKILLEVVKERLKKSDIDKGVVLDGGFRTLEETEKFSNMLVETGKDFSVKVFYLRVSRWKCLDRLLGENGRKRNDDTLDGILKRVREFDKDLGKRMSFIRSNFSLEIIDGDQSKEEVQQDILERLN